MTTTTAKINSPPARRRTRREYLTPPVATATEAERPLWAGFVFVTGFISISLLALLAMLSRTPFVFPSLGPTAILFFLTPKSPTASPRHTIYGHAIGIACGYGSLWLFALRHAPPALVTGVDTRRVLAAGLSLAATGGLMVLAKSIHPPAGATTLIVSLGIVTRPSHLIIIEVAVALLTLQAIAINRAVGIPYPLWAVEKQNGNHAPRSSAAGSTFHWLPRNDSSVGSLE